MSALGPEPRKGIRSPRLAESEFKRRFLSRFTDECFDLRRAATSRRRARNRLGQDRARAPSHAVRSSAYSTSSPGQAASVATDVIGLASSAAVIR